MSCDCHVTTTLQDESAQSELEYRGQLKVGLMFELEEVGVAGTQGRKKGRGLLHVAIMEAEDLPKMNATGRADAVAKCYLLPYRTSSNKRKTQVCLTAYMYMYMYMYNRLFMRLCEIAQIYMYICTCKSHNLYLQ